MSGSVTVVGVERLKATMHAAADDLGDMQTAGRTAGEIVRARAATAAPKRTGRLAASVRASSTASEVVVATSVVYAARVNYGMPSVGQVAQPFMSDALRDTERLVTAQYSRACARAVSQVRGA